jgi:hypothetical protein
VTIEDQVLNCLKEAIIIDTLDEDKTKNITLESLYSDDELIDLFSYHWIFNYSYKLGYRKKLLSYKSAKDAFKHFNEIKQALIWPCKLVWIDDKNFICELYNKANINVVMRCIETIGEFYEEDILISQNGKNRLKITLTSKHIKQSVVGNNVARLNG